MGAVVGLSVGLGVGVSVGRGVGDGVAVGLSVGDGVAVSRGVGNGVAVDTGRSTSVGVSEGAGECADVGEGVYVGNKPIALIDASTMAAAKHPQQHKTIARGITSKASFLPPTVGLTRAESNLRNIGLP